MTSIIPVSTTAVSGEVVPPSVSTTMARFPRSITLLRIASTTMGSVVMPVSYVSEVRRFTLTRTVSQGSRAS